ncbi:unnamed protein product [Pedinophyceae sp. YPF-701]|nr:unnamed protein product [Pedinophyceae sp. YPF-701]
MGSSLVDVVVVQVALEGRAGVMVKRLWDVAAQGLPACGVPALDAEIQGQLWDHLVHRTPEVVFSYHESAPASPRSHEKSKHTSTPFWVMPEEPLSGDDPALESFEAAVDAGVKVTAQFHVWELAAGIGVEKTSKFPIPDSHLKIVEILARARHQGALQRDVARLVNLKPENLWAQLRQLETRGLLVKFPIAAVNTTQESNTVTTNILFLPTFAPRIRAGKAHRFMPASDGGEKVQYILNDQEAPLRDICELLERHNGGPVLEKTFKAELGYVKVEGNRAWRRVREKLVRDGYIELGSAPKPTTGNKRKDDSRQATIRLLRPFGPAADESDEDETGGRGPRYFATPGLERQMLDVIAAGGARGASGPEVWQTLGVSGKAAAKRLVAPLARLGIQTTVETVGRGRMQVFTMPERHRKAAATLNRASVRAASRALVGAPAHQQRHGSDIMQVSDASCDDEAAPPPTPPEERTPPRSASPAHDRSSSDAGVEHRLLTAARRAGAAPGPGPGPGPGPTAAAGRRRSRRAGGRRSFMELSDDERSSRGGDTSEDDFTPGKTSDESEESDVESDDLDSDGPPRRKRGRPPRQAGTEPHGGAAEGSGRFWKGSGAARPEEYVQRYNAAAAFLQTCPDGWTFRAELSRAVADATTGGKKARLDRKLMLRLIDDLERDGHAVQAHVRLASGKSSAAGEVHVVGAPGATMTEEIRMRLDKRLADLNSLVRRQGIKARRERNPHTDVVRLAAQEPGTGGEDEAGSAKDTIMMKLAETGYCMQLMLRAKMTHLQLCQAARLWAGGHADPSGVPGDDAAPHGAGVVGGRSPARPAQPRKVTGGFSMPGPMNIGAANPTATSPGNRAAQPARGVAQEEELGPYRVSIAGLIMQMKLGEFARVVGVHPHPNLDLQRDSEVVVSDLPVDVQRTILSGNNLRRLTRAMDILERLGLVRSAAVSRTPAPGAAPAAAPVQFYAPSTEGCIDVPESFDDEHGGGYLAHAAVGASSAPGVRRATFDLRVEAHVHDWWNLLYFLTLSDPVFAASHRPGATEPAVTSTRKWVAADRDEEVGAYRELMERFHEMDHAPTFAEVREAAAEVGVAHEKAIRIKFQVDREKRRKKNGRVDSLRRKESEVRASGRITRRQPEVAAYQSLLGKARQDGAGQGVREEDDAEVEQEEDGVEVARAEGGRTGRRKRSWGESEDLSWMTSLVRYYLATGDVKDKVPTRLMTPSEEHLKHSQISVRLRRIRTVEASCRAFQALRTACIWGFVEAVPQSVHAAAVRAVAEGRAPEECAGKESVEVLRARLTEAPVEEAATVAQDSAFQARLKVCREAVEAVLSGPVLAREDVQDQDHKLLAKQERLLAEVEKGLQMLTATRPRRVERIAQLLARLLTGARRQRR